MADAQKTPKASKPEKSTAKKDTANKPNVFGKIKQFFKDIKGETKKIVWNSWSDTVKDTGVVFLVTAVVGAGVWISDLLFSKVIALLF